MHHGIIINQEFTDPNFPETFKIFAKKQDGDWGIYGIEIGETELENTILKIQGAMKENQPWYAHLYDDEELIVIFKNEIFRVKPHFSTWEPIVEYGKNLNIPKEQLDFWPNRFQDEAHYFSKKDFK